MINANSATQDHLTRHVRDRQAWYSKRAPRIFVSHNHADATFCHDLVGALRRAGADVWYDEHNLRTGNLIPEIEVELRDRPIFVVVLSPAALNSPWVADECQWAYNCQKRDSTRIILPILAEAVEEGSLWLFLEGFKRIESTGLKPCPHSEAIRRTLAALSLAYPGESTEWIAPQPGEPIEDILGRGAALHCQGKYSAALSLFQYATEHAPDLPAAWADLASALSSLERFDDSLSAYNHAINLDPDSADFRNNRAWVLNTVGRYREALSELEIAATKDPANAAIWNNVGWALLMLERHVEALDALDKAVALAPHDPIILSNRGAALHSVGRLEEAWQAYQDALTFDPDNMVIVRNQARVASELSQILAMDDPKNAKYLYVHQMRREKTCMFCSHVRVTHDLRNVTLSQDGV